MIRRPPRSTPLYSSAASDVYKRQTDNQGSGLGLAIVKHLANNLNGEVGIESKTHEGSIFWFTLPSYHS